MTVEEYKAELAKLKEDAKKAERKLINDYAFSNNPYKVGDIVKDNHDIIKIERIQATIVFGDNIPSCVYSGSKLKKDLTPMKNGDKGTIYQSNSNIKK